MDYVYRYTDNNDGIVKYIGRSKRKLDCRINEHENLDNWIKKGSWRIDYFEVPNQAYSEAWESHLIAFYKTYNWYNKAKADWGIIQEFLLKPVHWRLYSDNGLVINIPFEKYITFQENDRILNNNQRLISDLEISLDLDIPIDEIHKMVALHKICPLAKTENDHLLFLEDDYEKCYNYFNSMEYCL